MRIFFRDLRYHRDTNYDYCEVKEKLIFPTKILISENKNK